MNLVMNVKKRIVHWAQVDEENALNAFVQRSAHRRAHKDFVRLKMYMDFEKTLPGNRWGTPIYRVNGKQLRSVMFNYIWLAERVDHLEGVINDLLIIGDNRLDLEHLR